VQFFRGPRRVLRLLATGPSLFVPSARLPLGEYRWYVWPLGRQGERLSAAVVRARLRVG
jgi:hypothetical protein